MRVRACRLRLFRLTVATGWLLAALAACAQPAPPAVGPTETASTSTFSPAYPDSGDFVFTAELYADHPLVGRLWRASDRQFSSWDELLEQVAGARYLLLGEKHDNPDHHRLQLSLLRYLLDQDQVASVSFEMLDSGAESRLQVVAQEGFDSLEALRDALQWDQQGWDWEFYGPLVAESLAAPVPVLTANISREQVGQVYAEPLAPEVAAVLDAASLAQMHADIDESHCNMLPASQFPAMVRVQQARDHRMAASLTTLDSATGLRLLVAGNFHVRRDLGVPRYLQSLWPDSGADRVVSLALLEVDPDSADPIDYLQAFSSELPYDYVWFTPAISDEDYCAGFAR